MELSALFRILKVYRNKIKQKTIRDNPWLLVIMAVFLIALLSLQFADLKYERALFYFPDTIDSALNGEYRILPRKQGLSQRILEYMTEYILGPSEIRSHGMFPRDTRVQAIFYRKGGEVVIDLDTNVLAETDGRVPDFESFLDILQTGIKMNFPRVRSVRFLVEGQELFVPPYTDEP